MLWIFLAVLFGAVLIGIPVVFALGLANIVLLTLMDVPYTVLPSRMISGMNSFPLLAIPFFMFVGEVMNRGGIARRLVTLADAFVGHVTGGLGHVNILASMFFGGISGSAIADTAAIGGLMVPPMVQQRYSPAYSAAVTASSAVIGIIIPPSIPFILFGIVTGTSIAHLFLGGIIPGIVVGFALMATTWITSRRHGYGTVEAGRRFSPKAVVAAFAEVWPALTLPLIIVGGILGGIFTATEAGAVAAIVAVSLGLFYYREITIRDIPRILLATVRTTAIVLFLCGMAMVSAWLLTRARVPVALAHLLVHITDSHLLILLLCNVLLFFIGCVMDLTPGIIILAPILTPVMTQIGIDPVYFGVIMCINLGIGLVTPPVGTVLYVASGVANVKLDQLIRALLPFLGTLLLVLTLLIVFPDLVTVIPNLFG
ncbi:MAG: TRAP transporter large permease [Spirochaetales bacterium]|nr:TRAP transporter large permease [Spirochaetales bacterium]